MVRGSYDHRGIWSYGVMGVRPYGHITEISDDNATPKRSLVQAQSVVPSCSCIVAMLYLTRPLIEGPHPICVPLPFRRVCPLPQLQCHGTCCSRTHTLWLIPGGFGILSVLWFHLLVPPYMILRMDPRGSVQFQSGMLARTFVCCFQSTVAGLRPCQCSSCCVYGKCERHCLCVALSQASLTHQKAMAIPCGWFEQRATPPWSGFH